MKKFQFKILNKDKNSLARTGIIQTQNGEIKTPEFVPVATAASVKALDSTDLEKLNAQCALANTYHLHLQPGEDLIKKQGGLHKFMNLKKPIFTDSGGFQAFSLGFGKEHGIGKLGFFTGKFEPQKNVKKFAKVTDKGVEFTSIRDGKRLFMSPKDSMKIQSKLGADIIMAFDECTSPLSDYDYKKKAMHRTHKWALESLKFKDKKQVLYGIIQGAEYKDLRKESRKFILSQPFEGIAIGGSLGKNKKEMYKILNWITPKLDERPIHLLGIGEVEDILEAVAMGIDTFDCVHPTRVARRGHFFIHPKSGGNKKNKFRMCIKNSKYKNDKKPIDKNCKCFVCQNYSRAYLHHLYKAKELTYFRLASFHNLWFMLRLMENIRESINKNKFIKLKNKWLK